MNVQEWCGWLRRIWAIDAVADAVEHASPVLARQMEAVCAGRCPEARQARRMVLSMCRYVLRMSGRATPFGLFAGVAPARIGRDFAVRWDGGHRAVARANASWLADVIVRLESCPPVLARLPLVANNLCFVRGGRFVVPYQPASPAGYRAAAVEVSIRHTAAVRIVVQAARSPIRCGELAGNLAAEFPTAGPAAIGRLLTDLVERRVLISSLHAPSTVIDAFAHLMEQLDAVDAADIPEAADVLYQLREINAGLAQHNRAGTAGGDRATRTAVAERMAALTGTERQPLAVDLRLD